MDNNNTKFENEILSKGYLVYTCEGDSMMPLLCQHKDIVVIKKITEPLKKYDTVLYKRPTGAYVLHRIIKVLGLGQYEIVGDNRYYSEKVPEEWIIGILSEVIKDGRHISVDSDEYKSYVKKVARQRLKLKIKRYPRAIKRRIAKLFRIGRKD